MRAGSYYFEPSELTAELDDRVVITLTTDDENHSIRIPGFFIEQDVFVGEETIIEFIATKPGEFVYYSIEDEDMKGKLIVVDPEAEE